MTDTISKQKLIDYLESEISKVTDNHFYYGREQALLGVLSELLNGGFDIEDNDFGFDRKDW